MERTSQFKNPLQVFFANAGIRGLFWQKYVLSDSLHIGSVLIHLETYEAIEVEKLEYLFGAFLNNQ